jgi:hypothetical protein
LAGDVERLARLQRQFLRLDQAGPVAPGSLAPKRANSAGR